MGKKVYYFSHDFGARNDPKLQGVMMEHGVAGLGIFWCIIEHLYEQGGKMPLHSIKAIAFGLHVDESEVEELIKNFELFKYDDEFFWSESVLSRLKKRDDANESRRQKRLAYIRLQKERQLQQNLESTSTKHEDNSIAAKTVAENERKEKDVSANDNETAGRKDDSSQKESTPSKSSPNKRQPTSHFTPPTIEQVRDYITSRNSTINPETFWNFYETKGWMVGKNKMKDWKACVRTWENNDRQNERNKIAQNNGISFASYGRVGSDGQEHH